MNRSHTVILLGVILTLSAASLNLGVSAQVDGTAKTTLVGKILHSDGTPAVPVGVGLLSVENPQCAPAAFGVQPDGATPARYSSLAAYSVTDGEGKYRFENVPPGRYYLLAGAFFMGGEQRGPCFRQGGYTGFIAEPTYHPGTRVLAVATPLALTASDATLPDLRFAAGTGFRVSGRIVGTPVVNAGGQLLLILGNPGAVPSQGPCSAFRASVGPDRSFEFRDVPPCNYLLRVQANYGDTGRGAFPGGGGAVNVTVVDKNITGLVLGQ